jgi:FtsP/CotA-like multicopper oxidase with cupredoxin domain
MNDVMKKCMQFSVGAILILLFVGTMPAYAALPGISGTTFDITATTGSIITTDGNSIYMWGYGVNGNMQMPGPTLILTEGQNVTINLSNTLPMAVSMVFPGQTGVVASGGLPGLLTREAPPGGTVTYTFTASAPGTYMYHSGTRPDLQIEMGLVGAIIIRPLGPIPATFIGRAYGNDETAFNREYLFLLQEIEPRVHDLARQGLFSQIDYTIPRPTHQGIVYWLINGRDGPDTLAADFTPSLPTQPYSALARMHPGEVTLMRIIGAGRQAHPFHAHGNQHNQIARDGRLMESAPGQGPDMQESVFTSNVNPGMTIDARFTWTGNGLGWDIYGHAPGDPCQPYEDCSPTGYHGVPAPVALPSVQATTNGIFWNGGLYLGLSEPLPPGEGGYNPTAAYFYMWHSHAEKELTSNNIFPGGMLTFGVIEHWNVVIEPGNP